MEPRPHERALWAVAQVLPLNPTLEGFEPPQLLSRVNSTTRPSNRLTCLTQFADYKVAFQIAILSCTVDSPLLHNRIWKLFFLQIYTNENVDVGLQKFGIILLFYYYFDALRDHPSR